MKRFEIDIFVYILICTFSLWFPPSLSLSLLLLFHIIFYFCQWIFASVAHPAIILCCFCVPTTDAYYYYVIEKSVNESRSFEGYTLYTLLWPTDRPTLKRTYSAHKLLAPECCELLHISSSAMEYIMIIIIIQYATEFAYDYFIKLCAGRVRRRQKRRRRWENVISDHWCKS